MKESKKSSDSKANQEFKKLRNEISSLTYKESLEKLDFILQKLQHDEVAVEDLQRQYLQGRLYLERCETLLNQVEQEVTEMKLG